MNGILLVASVYKPYLTSAQMLADSIKEYSNIPITLFTIDEWKNEVPNKIINIIEKKYNKEMIDLGYL